MDLGDERLDQRAAVLLSALGNRPNLSIPAARGGRAEMEAAYRFFDKILQPHADRTLCRLGDRKVVLLIQDATEVDLTRPEQDVAGVGTPDGARRGFLLHQPHAFTPDAVPLGALWAGTLNRTDPEPVPAARQTRRQRQCTPTEQKESLRRLTGPRQARAVARPLPAVTCACVAGSEAGIYELLAEPRGEAPVHWPSRARQDRALTTEPGRHPREEPRLARVVVGYYRVRWSIGILFRTLKSGCRTERRRFEDITRVPPRLASYLIVAWRALLVCRTGRGCPELGREAIFEPSEWEAVWVAVRRAKPPARIPR